MGKLFDGLGGFVGLVGVTITVAVGVSVVGFIVLNAWTFRRP